jgi:nitroreductase
MELAKRRKSVRRFSEKEVPLEEVLRALETATLAPSGANQQPWRFIILTDAEVKRLVREACERGERDFYDQVDGEFREWLLGQGLTWRKPFLEDAPVLVAVLMREDAQYARESVWVAVGFILLALEELGLNSLTYTPSNTEYPLAKLNAQEGFKLEAIIPIGYSADDTPKAPKMRLDEVAFLNRWGEAIR